MEDFRCRCSKLILQMTENEIIIKCRHCKRFIIIYTKGIDGVEYANSVHPKMFIQGKKTAPVYLR